MNSNVRKFATLYIGKTETIHASEGALISRNIPDIPNY